MRFVIQRVTSAKVDIDGQTKGSVKKGFCVLIGIGKGDDEAVADKLISKMIGLRIFEDSRRRTPSDITVHFVCRLQKRTPPRLYGCMRAPKGGRTLPIHR